MAEPVAQRGLGERGGLLAHGGALAGAARGWSPRPEAPPPARSRVCSSRARGEQRVVAGQARRRAFEVPERRPLHDGGLAAAVGDTARLDGGHQRRVRRADSLHRIERCVHRGGGEVAMQQQHLDERPRPGIELPAFLGSFPSTDDPVKPEVSTTSDDTESAPSADPGDADAA